MKKIYSYEEARESSLDYFGGDELAATVSVTKYALKNEKGEFLERNPDDMLRWRLTPEFSRIEKKYANPLSEEVIYNALKGFRYVVGQGGLLYGIGNLFKLVSVGNCFVVKSPSDSYGSICTTDQQIIHIGKRRGGNGVDISHIRPKGFSVNNAAQTTDGIIAFMQRFSNTTHEVAQAGGRRGALMITLLCSHMQILDFIKCKRDKTKVTGANISVKFTDEFFDCLKNKKPFTLRHPANAPVEEAEYKTEIDPQIIWDEFIESNHQSAEPGCLYWSNLINDSISDCYTDEGFETVSTNPCVTGDSLVCTNLGDITIKQLLKLFLESKDNSDKEIKVYTFNEKTKQVELKTLLDCFLTKKNTPVMKLKTKDGSELKLTSNHKVFTQRRGWINASRLEVSDVLLRISRDENGDYSEINELQVESAEIVTNEDVYDLRVEDNHNFFANKILVHNCGELPLPPNASCILMLLNLYSFVKNPYTEKAEFDFEEFDKQVMIATRLMDDTIDLEIEKVTAIIAKIEKDPESEDDKKIELDLWHNILKCLYDGRRVGLGITALADMFAALNIKYASQEALDISEKLFSFMHDRNFYYNAVLAKERGAFSCWDWEKEKDNNHIKLLRPETVEMIKKHGRRNISTSTIAPAGSVSILTQTSSGVEPVFKAVYSRKKKISPDEEKKGIKVDEVDSDNNKWTYFDIFHPGLKRFMDITGKKFEDSPYYKNESHDIPWKYRVELQSLIGKYITHAISSTLNLHKDVTRQELSEIYLAGHKGKCKGLTTYRDGCRDGVLTTKGENKVKIVDARAPKRPKDLPCEIYHSNVMSKTTGVTEKWIFFISIHEGRPYEVFGGKKGIMDIAKKHTNGWIIKNGKNAHGNSTYDLYLGTLEESDDRTIIKDIASQFKPEEGTITRMTSLSLRFGTPVHEIVEQLSKDVDSPMIAIEKCISRLLKHHIKDGITASETESCPLCKSKLVYKDGCISCSRENDAVCPWSKC